jgi:hypothetical protein
LFKQHKIYALFTISGIKRLLFKQHKISSLFTISGIKRLLFKQHKISSLFTISGIKFNAAFTTQTTLNTNKKNHPCGPWGGLVTPPFGFFFHFFKFF